MQIDGFTWYYIFAAELKDPYSLYVKELPPSHSTFPATSWPSFDGQNLAFQYTLDGRVTKMVDFGSDSYWTSHIQCDESNFQYWIIAPCLPNLLGELTKIIALSEM